MSEALASWVGSESAVKQSVSPAEWEARVKLAAAYRIAAQQRWTDHIYTHFSLRVPGPEAHFLINPYGLTFDEITASSLVKVDIDGRILHDETGYGINHAGYIIHSAIHRELPHIHAVVHTHTAAGIAVSAQQHGLLMISQHAMRFYQRVGYHDYEGIALEEDEQPRLLADLGPHRALILRNHGLLTAGTTLEEAFAELYFLERACVAQIQALSGGEVIIAPDHVAAKVAHQVEQNRQDSRAAKRHWDALVRQVDRLDPSYRL